MELLTEGVPSQDPCERTVPKNRRLSIAAIFAVSVLAAFVVLNRWLFTDIGLLSFGRVWQFYVSYEEFGFVRRALVGTLFSVTGLNRLFSNEYHFALLVQHIAILIFAALVWFYIFRRGIDHIWLVVTVALSPAMIIQSGYTTGSLDIFVLILAAINILYCRRLIPFCAVLIVGIFLHELFVFTIPAQLVAYSFLLRDQGCRLARPAAAGALSILSALGLLLIAGATDMPEATFEGIMAAKMPLAAGQHGLWSGFYELSSSTVKYASEAMRGLAIEISLGVAFLGVPLLYTALVLGRLLTCGRDWRDQLMLGMVTVFPLFAAVLATDLYRWIGLSASMGLLLTLVMVGRGAVPRTGFTYALLPFCLLAPLGAGQIDWPFPLHQYVLERVFF